MSPSVETIDPVLEAAWLRANAEALDPSEPCPREAIGLRNAIIRCGMLPDVATVEAFCAAVYHSGTEIERIERVWRRYRRRFNLPEAEIDASPTRLHVRYLIVVDIYTARCEWSKLLIFAPTAGTA
jgi:hypothetical protein